MNTVLKVLRDFGQFFNLKTKKGKVRILILLAIFVAGFFFLKPSADIEDDSTKQVRAVSTAAVHSFSNSISTQLVGTVSSIDQAIIQSEASGRVTSVEVTLGQTISTGQVIARLENASEYAAVLQAEGAYDGARASAQISDVSVSGSENSLINANNNAYAAYTSAYSSLRDIYQSNLDLIVADPDNTFRTPGARLISSGGRIDEVDGQFEALGILVSNPLLPNTTDGPVSLLLNDAQTTGELMMALVNNLQSLIEDDDTDTAYEATELTYLSTLSSAQSQIDSVLLSLKNADSTLTAAKAALKKSQLGGTSGEVSAANAQVKQALGSLRAAQASYNKTILRSPIAGVVNAVDIKTGDFVSGFQTVAEVANNDALEITTFVGQSDRSALVVQQEVLIEGVIPGVVSAIAPAVNASTGKIEVKIQSTSPDLVNGDTVVIFLESQNGIEGPSVLQVPLTAVKFTASAGVVYSVTDDVLVAHAVEIGAVRDIFIEILSGIPAEMEIVVDARGLNEGEHVSVVAN